MNEIDKEIIRRRDMREALTFTIDPEDAKDFDDALSFQETKDVNCPSLTRCKIVKSL